MSGNKQDFLRYLDACRKEVEQWPSWKQEALKAPAREAAQKVAATQNAGQPKR
ncbi:hypothetical protein [Pseudomonas entomophila]|uniref:hypothetical protein n=1 Tax=Pseudomonas entomophila TaxID=312306 RepID=UPI00200C665B|nr:hypothetical protein [Pseudomonas entomophila]